MTRINEFIRLDDFLGEQPEYEFGTADVYRNLYHSNELENLVDGHMESDGSLLLEKAPVEETEPENYVVVGRATGSMVTEYHQFYVEPDEIDEARRDFSRRGYSPVIVAGEIPTSELLEP